MIKLIKILGKGNNVPEITSVKAPYGRHVTKGAVYFISGGSLSYIKDSDVLVRFIPIESLEDGHKIPLVKGYIVTPGMIFEADTVGDFSEKNVGDNFALYEDSNNDLTAISSDIGSDGNIISMDDHSTTGKVLITLNS